MNLRNKKYFNDNDFLLTTSCPTKLFYEKNPGTYAEVPEIRPFLRKVYQGRFQIQELVKTMYPGGVQIQELTEDESIKQTKNYLKKSNSVTLFDSSYDHQNLLTRIPIFIKEYEKIELIFTTCNPLDPYSFEDEVFEQNSNQKDEITLTNNWGDIFYQMAYSFMIIKNRFPKSKIKLTLMGVNPNSRTSLDYMNQLIYLMKDQEYYHLTREENIDDRFANVFTQYDVTKIVSSFFFPNSQNKKNFENTVLVYAQKMLDNVKIDHLVGHQCENCFYKRQEEGKKSGARECWEKHLGISQEDSKNISNIQLFNYIDQFFWLKSNQQLSAHRSLRDLYDNIGKNDKKDIREEIQTVGEKIIHPKDIIKSNYLKENSLNLIINEMKEWEYPLHFIHIKECSIILPFSKKQKTFRMAAYQFSHHVMYENGEVTHAGESFMSNKGEYPTFSLIRNLKNELDKTSGTIITYSENENRIFNTVKNDLSESDEKDKDMLIRWLDSIIVNPLVEESSRIIRIHHRHVVHLESFLLKCFSSKGTEQTFSVKKFFNTIISQSDYLQDKYSKPIYGTDGPMTSTNFRLTNIIEFNKNNQIISPYDILPKFFNLSFDDLQEVLPEYPSTSISSFLYSYLQFIQLDIIEREETKEIMLKYAEFDTLSMVIIIQHLKKLMSDKQKKSKKSG